MRLFFSPHLDDFVFPRTVICPALDIQHQYILDVVGCTHLCHGDALQCPCCRHRRVSAAQPGLLEIEDVRRVAAWLAALGALVCVFAEPRRIPVARHLHLPRLPSCTSLPAPSAPPAMPTSPTLPTDSPATVRCRLWTSHVARQQACGRIYASARTCKSTGCRKALRPHQHHHNHHTDGCAPNHSANVGPRVARTSTPHLTRRGR